MRVAKYTTYDNANGRLWYWLRNWKWQIANSKLKLRRPGVWQKRASEHRGRRETWSAHCGCHSYKIAKIWHTRCARWRKDFNIEHTLNTLWTHSEQTLNTLWTHSEHTLNKLWTHSEHTLNTLWTCPEHTLNTLWTHSEHTLNTLWTHSEHTLNIPWTYPEDSQMICRRFDKISKTLINDSLTDSPTWIQEMLAHLKMWSVCKNGRVKILKSVENKWLVKWAVPTCCRQQTPDYSDLRAAHPSSQNNTFCVTRAPLLYFIRSWVALSFKVCQWVSEWVRHRWHLTRSPLCAIYKGIDALYWPSIINFQLSPPHSVLDTDPVHSFIIS